MLIDRELERAQIARVLDAAGQGLSGVLVLRGEPGVGKTALLGHAVEAAQGYSVVRVAGIESEAELGFAALHQLLLPFLGHLPQLPPPQRRALATALGLDQAGAPDRFLVGLAALTLLSTAAAAKPLLCVVDDVQWLDQESAGALAFVARRLSVDAIAMLFAVRDPAERRVALEGLPELRLGGLPEADARQLLASSAGGPLDAGVSAHIISRTGGNPLALIEVGRELAPGQRSGPCRCLSPCRSARAWRTGSCARSGPCPPPRRSCC